MIEEAKAILGRDFASDVSLVALARQLHCSPANLSRIFHAATGVRLADYRLELRLRKAVALLEESDFGIGDIGIQVGFASHSHFTSAFHQHFGMNPSRFLRTRPERLDALIPQPPLVERREPAQFLAGAAA
jgi:transcriptional regulator GlxA family with amidase domain